MERRLVPRKEAQSVLTPESNQDYSKALVIIGTPEINHETLVSMQYLGISVLEASRALNHL
jgi:hypothetical protein